MLRVILVAAGTVMVAVAWRTTSAAHDPEHVRLITCAAFALPVLFLVVLLNRRAQKSKAAPAPAPRTGYSSSLGQPPARRR